MKLILALTAAALCATQDSNERLRKNLKDNSLAGTWTYDDLEAGYAEAKKTGKPLLVVLRCVP